MSARGYLLVILTTLSAFNQLDRQLMGTSWLWFATAFIAASHANPASAQLSVFQTEWQAQQHCPNDTVVWLDTRKRIYYVNGHRVPTGGPKKRIRR
jgi:hypothetical protein